MLLQRQGSFGQTGNLQPIRQLLCVCRGIFSWNAKAQIEGRGGVMCWISKELFSKLYANGSRGRVETGDNYSFHSFLPFLDFVIFHFLLMLVLFSNTILVYFPASASHFL